MSKQRSFNNLSKVRIKLNVFVFQHQQIICPIVRTLFALVKIPLCFARYFRRIFLNTAYFQIRQQFQDREPLKIISPPPSPVSFNFKSAIFLLSRCWCPLWEIRHPLEICAAVTLYLNCARW